MFELMIIWIMPIGNGTFIVRHYTTPQKVTYQVTEFEKSQGMAST